MCRISRRVLKNISVLFIGQFISLFLNFYFVIITARYLGSEQFGILAFALALANILGGLLDPGLHTLLIREIARKKEFAREYLGNILVIKIFLIPLSILIMISVLCFIHSVLTKTKAILIIFLFISTILDSFSGMFYSLYHFVVWLLNKYLIYPL